MYLAEEGSRGTVGEYLKVRTGVVSETWLHSEREEFYQASEVNIDKSWTESVRKGFSARREGCETGRSRGA